MKGIIVLMNGKKMDLGDINISFEFINPLFSENKFNSFWSFSHVLPATSKNKSQLKYANRNDTENNIQYDYQLLVNGFQFIDAIAKAKVSDNGIAVTVVSRGVEFVKKATKRTVRDFDYGSIQICDPDDTNSDKINAWFDHIYEKNMTELPTEGTHKFPMIFTAGYDGNYGKENYLHFKNFHVVNPMCESTFMKNFSFPKSLLDKVEARWWPYTVSPCLRLEHILNTLMNYFGFRTEGLNILDNQEFLQAVAFSGVVADDIRVEGIGDAAIINVHGTSINLSDFLPNTSLLDFFLMIYEVWGYSFVVSKNSVEFINAGDIIRKAPSDFSKYYVVESESEIVDYQSVKINYDAEKENEELHLNMPYWNMPGSALDGDGKFTQNDDQSHQGIDTNIDEVSTDISLKHYPMKSTFKAREGFLRNVTGYNNEEATGSISDISREGYSEFMPSFVYPGGIMSANDISNDKRAERWYIGCIRGIHNTITATSPLSIIGYPNSIWPYNYATTEWDDRNISVPFNHTFGNSIYLTATKGTWQQWLYNIAKLENADIIIRKVQMPLHVLEKLKKFDDINHILKDRRGNKVGILEKIAGSITSEGIANVEFYYRVPKSVLFKGDFNEDFSQDFNS